MKSFMERIFLIFHFVLCCTQQNAMLGNCHFEKSGEARAPPGPNDATPMRKVVSYLRTSIYESS